MAEPLRIFVTVGNATQPFDRLLQWAEEAISRYPDECHGICQHGVSAVRVSRLANTEALSKQSFLDALAASDVVLCHAGVGTLLDVMGCGLIPGVAVRLALHNEIANDHQLEIAQALAQQQRIRLVTCPDDIARLLMHPPSRVQPSQDQPLPKVLEQAIRLKKARPRWGALRVLASLSPSLERLKLR